MLSASSGGHFVTQGLVNSRPVQFLVDTGAREFNVIHVSRLSLALERLIAELTARGVDVIDCSSGGLMGSATTLSGAFGLLAFMGLADRIQRRVRTYVACVAVSAAVPLIMLVAAYHWADTGGQTTRLGPAGLRRARLRKRGAIHPPCWKPRHAGRGDHCLPGLETGGRAARALSALHCRAGRGPGRSAGA